MAYLSVTQCGTAVDIPNREQVQVRYPTAQPIALTLSQSPTAPPEFYFPACLAFGATQRLRWVFFVRMAAHLPTAQGQIRSHRLSFRASGPRQKEIGNPL